jgi:hypothetical protein
MIKIELPKEGFKSIVQYGVQPVYAFRYDVEETENETVACDEVSFTLEKATYENMVAKCIGVKYNTDAQLALLYNYEADKEKYAEAMDQYQEWRVYCKESAKEFFGVDTEE